MSEKHESGNGGGQVTAMTLERLRAILDAYGAARARWPAAERRAAQHLLAENKDARGLFAEAREFDRLLDGVIAPPPTAGLTGRVLSLPGQNEGAKQNKGGMGSWCPQAIRRPAALLAAGVIGFVIGASLPGAEPPLAVPAAALVATEFDTGVEFQDETSLIGLTWPEAEPPDDGSEIDANGEEEFDSASLI